jgi:hypothetical protein
VKRREFIALLDAAAAAAACRRGAAVRPHAAVETDIHYSTDHARRTALEAVCSVCQATLLVDRGFTGSPELTPNPSGVPRTFPHEIDEIALLCCETGGGVIKRTPGIEADKTERLAVFRRNVLREVIDHAVRA